MSIFEPGSSASWGGEPVARHLGEARPRDRVVVTGTIGGMEIVEVGGSASAAYVLDDGTGQVTLVFLGRPAVPGLHEGARCTVEGTVRDRREALEVWNPLYRLEGSDG